MDAGRLPEQGREAEVRWLFQKCLLPKLLSMVTKPLLNLRGLGCVSCPARACLLLLAFPDFKLFRQNGIAAC